jgi:hypothetical protein
MQTTWPMSASHGRRTLRQERNVELAVAVLNARAGRRPQSRYDDLADRHSDGRLTDDELRELELLVRRNLQVAS